jgi:hypothetical protein
MYVCMYLHEYMSVVMVIIWYGCMQSMNGRTRAPVWKATRFPFPRSPLSSFVHAPRGQVLKRLNHPNITAFLGFQHVEDAESGRKVSQATTPSSLC